MNNFQLNEKGVWHIPSQKEGKEPEPIWICSPLEVVAITRDHDNENHGRLLRFCDSDGKEHFWAMPMELLASDGTEYRKNLLSMGLLISSNRQERSFLTTYIQSASPKEKIRCIDRIGWYEEAYVFPRETIGDNLRERIVFQSSKATPNPYGVLGTLEEWKKHVASYCVDNSRLSFAVSVGFAAPLLHLLEEEGGGYHFRGKSSGGKTTALKVGASLYGGKKMLGTWRATINGMEAVAFMHNDGLLCLDELGQLDSKEAGETAYLLANGLGKARASKIGFAREKCTWKLNFLSSGEVGLGDHMRQAGKKIRAGQEIRIVDISSETGQYGIFENLHDFDSGAEFSRMLAQNTHQFYGAAGVAFIKELVRNLPSAKERIKILCAKFITENNPSNADGQVLRVLHRMALVAAAGSFATELRITGWPEEEAFWGSSQCFQAWIKGRGGVFAQESRNILRQVRLFFELHGESRFSQQGTSCESKTPNRAGFKKEIFGKTYFFVLPEAFKMSVCEGLDPEIAIKVLREKDWLIQDSEGKSTRSENLPSFVGQQRCYRFDGEKIFTDDI